MVAAAFYDLVWQEGGKQGKKGMVWYDYEEEEEEELRVGVRRRRKGGKEGDENGHEGKGDDGMVILTTSSIPRLLEMEGGAGGLSSRARRET